MKKTFGERLEELRGDLSQRDFAKKIGVPLTSYTNWVLGVSQPKFENIYAICSSLGVSADWLLGLSGGSAASVPAAGPVPAVHGGAPCAPFGRHACRPYLPCLLPLPTATPPVSCLLSPVPCLLPPPPAA